MDDLCSNSIQEARFKPCFGHVPVRLTLSGLEKPKGIFRAWSGEHGRRERKRTLFERELRESSRRLSSGHLQIRGDILKIEGRSRLCEGDGNTTFFHKLAQLQDSGGK